MEQPGEQFNVFALIVMEPPSDCVCMGGGRCYFLSTNRFRNNLCKDDSALFSMVKCFLPSFKPEGIS
jgi:hypothetical protein